MQYGDEEPNLIFILQQRIKYVDKVVEILRNYHDLVKQKMKAVDLQHLTDSEMNGADDKQVYTGTFTHEKTLKILLNQIKFLLSGSGVQLGVENIKLMWRLFVDEPNYVKEQSMFIKWINRSKADHNSQKLFFDIFTQDEKRYIFLQVLCPSVANPEANINLTKCFSTYFLMINKLEGALKNA